MAINPEDPDDRLRLSRSLQYWHQQLQCYREARRETVMNISGSTEFAAALGIDIGKSKRPWGNLLQMSSIANGIKLAYNDPRFVAVANNADGEAIAPRLESFLNKYSRLINLGDIARQIATDAFVGYGIVKVAEGVLPPGARLAAGQSMGPMCWRVSQDNFVYDGSATSWDYVSYQGDLMLVPLKEAREFPEFLAYNEEGAKGLQEYNMKSDDNTDSRIHSNPLKSFNAQAMTRILYTYLPHSGLEVFWAANDLTFGGVKDKPLLVRKWKGHHNGPFSVMSLLDIPDNLVPVAQAESTKQLHYLFNELMDKGAIQAREAKVVPVYELGSQRDMDRLEGADDRRPVGVSNIQKIGMWEKPGPTQSQSAYALAALQLYKEFSGNIDDTLGLGPTAGTATQSALIRQSTNARGADARRRMDRMMEQVAEKLAHLALVDETLRLEMREKITGTEDIYIDTSWLPPVEMPRDPNISNYGITLVAQSMELRDPTERLANINEAMGQIIQVAQVVAMGVPIALDKFIKIQSNYRDLPELLELYSDVLAAMQAPQEGGGMGAMGGISDPNKPNGDYQRTNVSERSNQGALTQNMSQVPGGEPSVPKTGGMIATA